MTDDRLIGDRDSLGTSVVDDSRGRRALEGLQSEQLGDGLALDRGGRPALALASGSFLLVSRDGLGASLGDAFQIREGKLTLRVQRRVPLAAERTDGVVDGTLEKAEPAAAPASYNQATVQAIVDELVEKLNDNVAELQAEVVALRAALLAAGIVT